MLYWPIGPLLSVLSTLLFTAALMKRINGCVVNACLNGSLQSTSVPYNEGVFNVRVQALEYFHSVFANVTTHSHGTITLCLDGVRTYHSPDSRVVVNGHD
jgi:hypothetical protein